jgi:hypothetical protein
MAAENNTILVNDLAKVRVVDFNNQFTGSIKKLVEALGITRKIAVQEGTSLKAYKVTGELESGAVAEGELIPLSHYETEEVVVAEAVLNKWRKGTTAESILKRGYDQAVGDTTDRMVKDIQKGIRKDFFDYFANAEGVTSAEGTGLQAALANGWGKLQVLWEDDAVDTVYMVNPLDVADYLGNAEVSMQNLFGMKYIEDFLGLGSVITNSNVPKGTYYATAKENLVMYYVNVATSELARAFELTTDETGYIGINEYPDKDTARVMDLVMSGVTFFPERMDGIVKGTIGSVGA